MAEYIDREAAKKAFCEYCDWAEAGSKYCRSCPDPIGSIPAADVVPVVLCRDCKFTNPICENCIFVDEPLDKDPCRECNRVFLAQRIKPNFVSKRKPKTNADRIRSLSDEELAEFLDDVRDDWGCSHYPHGTEDWLDWLKQEAAE
jgi:hypothetical protein